MYNESSTNISLYYYYHLCYCHAFAFIIYNSQFWVSDRNQVLIFGICEADRGWTTYRNVQPSCSRPVSPTSRNPAVWVSGWITSTPLSACISIPQSNSNISLQDDTFFHLSKSSSLLILVSNCHVPPNFQHKTSCLPAFPCPPPPPTPLVWAVQWSSSYWAPTSHLQPLHRACHMLLLD